MGEFKLKKGCAFRIKFGDPRILTSESLTDELAIELLENKPETLRFFEQVPVSFGKI